MKAFKFKINGNQYDTKLLSLEGNIAEIEVNGSLYKIELEKEIKSDKTPKLVRPKSAKSNVLAPKAAQTEGLSRIEAPLPGVVQKMLVKEGDSVKKGQTLLVLEAMKMENNILSEKEGTVKSLKVKEGESVLQGALLAEIE